MRMSKRYIPCMTLLTSNSNVSRCVILVRSGKTWTKLIARAKYAVPGTREPNVGSERMV